MEQIVLNQVSVYLLNQQEPVLKGINLVVQPGEWLTIVGHNGSGKSVLGKLLAGMEGSYSGIIQRPGRRTAVIAVMQNPESQLVGQTVWEEVTFGLENEGLPVEEIHNRADAALLQVGLNGLKHRLIPTLSGGQKQLLALASVIALRPSVIVADEVTSMLDPGSRRRVLDVLVSLQEEGITIISITQLLEEAAYSNRMIGLCRGEIVYEGSKEDFYYSRSSQDPNLTPCEIIGLRLPYTVKVVHELRKEGILIEGNPIQPEELMKVVGKG